MSRRWQEDVAWSAEHFPTEALDIGIVRVLRIFKEHGIETCQSCEGPEGIWRKGRHGEGHAYRYPTIDIHGEPWKALDVANAYDIQVDTVSEVFGVYHGRPSEHFWRIEFNAKQLDRFRQSWYRDGMMLSSIDKDVKDQSAET